MLTTSERIYLGQLLFGLAHTNGVAQALDYLQATADNPASTRRQAKVAQTMCDALLAEYRTWLLMDDVHQQM